MEKDVRPLVAGRLMVAEELLYVPDEPVAVVYELLPAEVAVTFVREVVVPALVPVLYEAKSRVTVVREGLAPLAPARPVVIFAAVPVRPETTAERVVRATLPSERRVRFVVPSETAVYAVRVEVRVPVLIRVPAAEAVVAVPPVREPPDIPPTAVTPEFPTRVPLA